MRPLRSLLVSGILLAAIVGTATAGPAFETPAPLISDDPSGQNLSEAQALSELKLNAHVLAQADTFSGAILIARDGKVLLANTEGFADRTAQTPIDLDTQFRLGSMNKMFTAVAVLQLVDAGQVALDAPLGKYLPDYPNAALSKVTIRQLLTHTGGTGDFFGPEFEAHRQDLKTLTDYVDRFGNRDPSFTPGDHFAYSNFGFILLGRVVEAVSGQSYYDYVDQHVFKPAGMTRSGFEPETVFLPGRATGYMRKDGNWVANTDTLPWRGTSAGGSYSTANDLLRFATALQDGRLLSKSLLAQATSAQVGSDGPKRYGLGFGVEGYGESPYFGHDGGAPGMNAVFKVYPKSGYTVIALSNFDPPVARDVVASFVKWIP